MRYSCYANQTGPPPANPDSRPTPIICFYARVRPRVDGGSPGRSNQPDMWGPGARALSALGSRQRRIARGRSPHTQDAALSPRLARRRRQLPSGRRRRARVRDCFANLGWYYLMVYIMEVVQFRRFKLWILIRRRVFNFSCQAARNRMDVTALSFSCALRADIFDTPIVRWRIFFFTRVLLLLAILGKLASMLPGFKSYRTNLTYDKSNTTCKQKQRKYTTNI